VKATLTRQVLALELLLGTVGQRLVKRLALADAHVLQRLGERLGIELLQADEAHIGDDGALFDDDDDRAAIDVDAHVLEQAGGEQRAQRRGTLVVVVVVADAKRQAGEHGTGVGTLQTLDADVLQHERIDGPGSTRLQRGGQRQRQQRGTHRRTLRQR
jgi:hypothetical protein